MGKLLCVAWATAAQLRREKLLYSGLIVALLVAFFGLALAPLSLHQDNRMVLDLGLATASVAGTLLAVSATVRVVGGELHEQRVGIVLARCLHRHTWLGGRTLGLGLAMAVVIAGIGGTTALLSWMVGGPLPSAFWPALALTAIEAVVVVCVTLLFVTWTTPTLSATFAGGIIVAGHMSAELLSLAPEGALSPGWYAAYWLLPDMQRLSLRAHVANGQAVDGLAFALQAFYGVSYAAAALLVAMVILTRRRCI